MNKTLFVVVAAVVMVIGLTAVLILNLDDRAEVCAAKNGVMLKTLSGWQCLDVKVIK